MAYSNCTKKTGRKQCFNAVNRQNLERWLNERVSKSEIARRLGISRQALYKEIEAGTVELQNYDCTWATRYDWQTAQNAHNQRIKWKGPGLKLDNSILKTIQNLIRKKWSPRVIAYHLKVRYRIVVSYRTIYNYMHSGILYLPNKKRHIYRFKDGLTLYRREKHHFPDGASSILDRPKSILNREEYGHYEIDSIVPARGGKKRILTLLERKTRAVYIALLADGSCLSVQKGLKYLIRKFHLKPRSITSDNGIEFKRLAEDFKKIKIYFARPFCSGDRGSNEHCNGMIRRFIPKKTKFDKLTQSSVLNIQEEINNYPRGIHNYLTANEMIAKEGGQYVTI